MRHKEHMEGKFEAIDNQLKRITETSKELNKEVTLLKEKIKC